MSLSVTIPRAAQLVLDDVGWREGWSLDETGGPWRAGVDRLMVTEDYEAIADIGEALNIRPQAAMVLCEWDKENICAACPTATQAGAAWDNSERAGPWSDDAAEVFRNRAAHIEFAMHGVGHEHWENGERTRAEWLGSPDGTRWEFEALRKHIEVFGRIMDQHGIGPADGHRFPVSAVPCAFNYHFDTSDPESTGSLFASAGVEQVSTPFGGGFHHHSPLAASDGAFEHGLVVVDRGSSGIPHNVYDTIPAELTRNSICGIHWPNILREDPSGNGEAVARWIEYMRAVGGQPDVMLASSMTECVAQWVYHTFVDLRVEGNEIVLDGTRIPDEALRYASSAPMWLKVQGTEPIRPEPVPDGPRLVGYDEGGDAVLLGLAGVRREVMRVRLHPGEAPRDPYVLRTGTSGTCDCSTEGHSTSVTVEACGRQVLQVRTGRPAVAVKVECDTPASAELLDFNVETGVQTVSVNAHDIQGAAVGLELIH